MDRDQSFPLKILKYMKTALGIRGVVALIDKAEGREIYRDEVKLWHADSRNRFALRCVAALNGNLPPKQSKTDRERIDAWLRDTEEKLKALIKNPAEASTSETNQPKEMTQQEREEALTLLRDPNLLVRVQEDLTQMGIVDEERNKVLIYLIATSRKMPQGLAATIKGSSSVGKNHLVNSVVSLIPEEEAKEYTQLSAKALHYMGENAIRNKLLICTEIVGREQAEYSVRALISEREITCATSVKDPNTGEWKTKDFKVNGPIAYLETTTSLIIHPENATRVFELYMNETEQQTEEVNRQQALEAGPEGFRIKQMRALISRIHQNAQRLLKAELDVVIPYAELIGFPTQDIRARRDFPKLLNLIMVIAFIHQFQRKIECQTDGKEYIEATVVDYELAYTIARKTFVETLDDLDKRSRDVVEAVKRALEECSKKDGKYIYKREFDRDDVAKWCGRPKNKLNLVFKELEEKEYFLSEETHFNTQKRTYHLNKNLLNAASPFEGLTTPEELKQKIKETCQEPAKVVIESGTIEGVIPLVPLYPSTEEKK